MNFGAFTGAAVIVVLLLFAKYLLMAVVVAGVYGWLSATRGGRDKPLDLSPKNESST